MDGHYDYAYDRPRHSGAPTLLHKMAGSGDRQQFGTRKESIFENHYQPELASSEGDFPFMGISLQNIQLWSDHEWAEPALELINRDLGADLESLRSDSQTMVGRELEKAPVTSVASCSPSSGQRLSSVVVGLLIASFLFSLGASVIAGVAYQRSTQPNQTATTIPVRKSIPENALKSPEGKALRIRKRMSAQK